MDNDSNFRWPDCPPYPPPSWWEVRGLELELDPDQIRFAAALVTLGGPDSRSNSMAAQLAGMQIDRTTAFRLARSVKVRRLIDEAEQTKKGERKPLTEDEIDHRIDKMIASPNDLAAAKGNELRDRRKTQREEREQAAAAWNLKPGELERNLICTLPNKGPAFALGNWFNGHGEIVTFPFLKECAPMVSQAFAADWSRWRDKHEDNEKAILDAAATGELLFGDSLVVALGGKVHKKRETQHAA